MYFAVMCLVRPSYDVIKLSLVVECLVVERSCLPQSLRLGGVLGCFCALRDVTYFFC